MRALTGMGDSRWRVILSAVSSGGTEATISFADAFTASAGEAAARRYPAHHSFAGCYVDRPNVFVALNVTAPDVASAERAGGEILTAELPSWIAVRGVEARPLLSEPDFTSRPHRRNLRVERYSSMRMSPSGIGSSSSAR